VPTMRSPRSSTRWCSPEFRRPADARNRSQGRGLSRSPAARVQRLSAAVIKNAQAMCATFNARGFRIISGGTDNHLFLMHLGEQGMTARMQDARSATPTSRSTRTRFPMIHDRRCRQRTANRHAGFDTRGFKEAEMSQVASWIADVIDAGGAEPSCSVCARRSSSCAGAFRLRLIG